MKAIRLHIKQNSANYRREETVGCRMTYPLPPYSTVIGALHKACGYNEYHPMKISIQGRYGSVKRRLFKEDCFLNSLQDDRGILVKLANPEMLSSAYRVVAQAKNGQGNSFDKGITIKVVDQKLLDEYRFLNRTKKRIEKHKKIVKQYKDKLKEMKNSNEVTQEELKTFTQRVKSLDKAYKKYEEEKYTKPKSYFRTLTKAPKWYEILCDIELVIHIVSDEGTMEDIVNNIGNLTSIGRSEDFVEVVECTETELESNGTKFRNNKVYDTYVPLDIILRNSGSFKLIAIDDGVFRCGTKYLLNKNYTTEQISGGYRKRVFERVPVLYTGRFRLKGLCDGVYLDTSGDEVYAVCLA